MDKYLILARSFAKRKVAYSICRVMLGYLLLHFDSKWPMF